MECDLEVETSGKTDSDYAEIGRLLIDLSFSIKAAEIPEELQPPNDSVRYIKRDPQFTGFVVTDEDDYCADENFMHCVAQLSSVMGRDAVFSSDRRDLVFANFI